MNLVKTLLIAGVCVKECPSLSNPPIDVDTLVTKNGVFTANNDNTTTMGIIDVADYSTSPNAQTCTIDDCYPIKMPISS